MITLSNMSTRELLKALRTVNYWLDCRADVEKFYVGSRCLPGGDRVSIYATRSEIREALNGREHVPGKREGKLLRQLKAKTGMTDSQLRSHPTYGRQLVDIQRAVPRRILRSPAEIRRYQELYGANFANYFYVER